MIISNMRFDSFEWQNNPLTVQVELRRRTSQQNMPMYGSVLTDIGCDLRVVKGTGELAGSDCVKQYAELCKVFEKGGKGLLTLPFADPFYAYFTDLALKGEATPDLITYTFEFSEAEHTQASDKKSRYCVTSEGDTLFDIAYREGLSVDELVSLNPQIKRPDVLEVGEKVRLC